MCKSPLALLAILGLCAALAVAQESAPASSATRAEKATPRPASVQRRAKAPATPVPVATPVPKKPGFWKRVFGNKRATPAPATPVVKATPAPRSKTARVRPKSTSAVEPMAKKAEDKKTVDGTSETSDDEKPKATPPPKKGSRASKAAEKADGPQPPEGADPDAVEKWKYDQARNKAMEEPRLQELRAKADAAAGDDESRKALRAYNEALFDRIRAIDPSIRDYTGKMESAVLKRLGE